MKSRPQQPGGQGVIKLGLAVAVVVIAAGLVWHFRGRTPSPPPSEASIPANNAASKAAPPDEVAASPTTAPQAAVPPPASTRPAPPPPSVAVTAAVDPAMNALVAGLSKLSGTNVTLSTEAAGEWRTNFLNLVQNGAAAVPALRAFLDQKVDYQFSDEVWQALGYKSARLAAIDALRQIGGPDAINAMEGLLGTSQSPQEIAVLARDLEEASPGQYRAQALAAARASLEAAAASKDPQLDVGPLFEVFSHYGDASTISDLEQAMGQWKYYATVALANLPDNAGVPTLLRLADPASGSGNRVVALEMVAQLAVGNSDARQFLTSQVANKAIPPNLWPYLAGPLTGDHYYPVDSAITPYPQVQSMSDLKTTHLAYGNQNFYSLPADQSLTPEGIQQRMELVDELLKSATDPAAVQTLQQARATLEHRGARTAAQPPPGTGQ